MDASKYRIKNTNEGDMDFVFKLFDEALEYQRRNGYNVWNGYDKDFLRRESDENRQYKIMIDDEIAMIFSVVYEDKILWREREKNNAIYLHRIVINPDFKGQKLYGKLLDWAILHAVERNLKFVRMDTWGDNPRLIKYYQSFGFRFIDNYRTPDDPELTIQHRNLYIALLEFDVETQKVLSLNTDQSDHTDCH